MSAYTDALNRVSQGIKNYELKFRNEYPGIEAQHLSLSFDGRIRDVETGKPLLECSIQVRTRAVPLLKEFDDEMSLKAERLTKAINEMLGTLG
jgi:hypothetical protein